jgi:hypothetical protein
MPAESGNALLSEKLERELSASACVRLLAEVTDDAASAAPVEALKQRLCASGFRFEGDEWERALLRLAASVTEHRISDLPVHASVRVRLREEFRFYTQPSGKDSFAAGSYLFATGCKVVALRRFPAGPMDWEISGMPRSWLAKIPLRDLLRTGLFIARELGGFAPFFFMHVARRPKNRSLLIEKEVMRSYYRMAKSLELQPSIRGIMAGAWFLDPAAVAANPHLEILSRPWREGHGLITTVGPAGPDAGFLEHNAARKEQMQAGGLSYRIGLGLWPRRQVLAWAAARPELED